MKTNLENSCEERILAPESEQPSKYGPFVLPFTHLTPQKILLSTVIILVGIFAIYSCMDNKNQSHLSSPLTQETSSLVNLASSGITQIIDHKNHCRDSGLHSETRAKKKASQSGNWHEHLEKKAKENWQKSGMTTQDAFKKVCKYAVTYVDYNQAIVDSIAAVWNTSEQVKCTREKAKSLWKQKKPSPKEIFRKIFSDKECSKLGIPEERWRASEEAVWENEPVIAKSIFEAKKKWQEKGTTEEQVYVIVFNEAKQKKYPQYKRAGYIATDVVRFTSPLTNFARYKAWSYWNEKKGTPVSIEHDLVKKYGITHQKAQEISDDALWYFNPRNIFAKRYARGQYGKKSRYNIILLTLNELIKDRAFESENLRIVGELAGQFAQNPSDAVKIVNTVIAKSPIKNHIPLYEAAAIALEKILIKGNHLFQAKERGTEIASIVNRELRRIHAAEEYNRRAVAKITVLAGRAQGIFDINAIQYAASLYVQYGATPQEYQTFIVENITNFAANSNLSWEETKSYLENDPIFKGYDAETKENLLKEAEVFYVSQKKTTETNDWKNVVGDTLRFAEEHAYDIEHARLVAARFADKAYLEEAFMNNPNQILNLDTFIDSLQTKPNYSCYNGKSEIPQTRVGIARTALFGLRLPVFEKIRRLVNFAIADLKQEESYANHPYGLKKFAEELITELVNNGFSASQIAYLVKSQLQTISKYYPETKGMNGQISQVLNQIFRRLKKDGFYSVLSMYLRKNYAYKAQPKHDVTGYEVLCNNRLFLE